MNQFHCRIESRAVTLVEVLVVTSIVLVLVALTFTIVRAAMDAAKKTTCMNNLKQQFSALKLYEETTGFYPRFWDDLVAQVPSVRSQLICPSDSTQGFGTNPLLEGGPSTPRFPSTSLIPPHSYNQTFWLAWWLANGRPSNVNIENARPADFSDPTMPIVLCDWHLRKLPQGGTTHGKVLHQTLFNDGHVGWQSNARSDLLRWFALTERD
jgi:type II secretory pathway pseudopilin PulG